MLKFYFEYKNILVKLSDTSVVFSFSANCGKEESFLKFTCLFLITLAVG